MNLLEIVHVMASSLDQLKKVTVVVADTGDFGGKSHVRSWVWGGGGREPGRVEFLGNFIIHIIYGVGYL